MYLLHKRLKHIKFRLKEWNKKDFGNIFIDKISVEIKLQELNQALIIDGFDKVKSEQLINTTKNGRIYANKRKSFGNKILEFNGSKKVKEIPDFSTDPP